MATQTQARTAGEVAQSAFDAFKERDFDKLAANWREDGVEEIVPVGIFRGPREICDNVREIIAAAPDIEPVLERIVADGDHAALQWRASGTFDGEPIQGIQPTGSHIELRFVEMIEVEDGLIVRNTAYYDGAAFARQIGMMPEQESGAEKAMIAAFNAVTKLRNAIARRKASA
jgi:ketosteroid isomerase-like protein